MAKETMLFDAAQNYYELEADEAEVMARRIQTYSQHALKVGLPVDAVFANHTRFKEGLDSISRIFQIAREVSMPHGMRVIGPSGSGKSTLIKYFCDSLPKSSLFAGGFGSVAIRVGKQPTAGEVVAALLRHYKYPFPTVTPSTIPIRKYHAFDLIRMKGTRIVLVDCAHHLLSQVRRRNNVSGETDATSLLSEMMDETNVGLVLCGQSGLDELLDIEPDLVDRVTGRIELIHFAPDQEWAALLKAFMTHCN
jgi:energy-coupling factor transporter ATP-binding protein EcfA2